ncbi:hypothetical protein ACFX14_024707 [Malus domestica]
MEGFQLTKEWQESIYISNSVCGCVSTHYFMCVRGPAPPILSLENIAQGVFDERAIKAWIEVTKKDREDALVQMEKMLQDCDVSIVAALHYASRFELPFENDGSFGKQAPVGSDTLHKFMIHNYRKIEGADEVTIKHMLKQFSRSLSVRCSIRIQTLSLFS